MVHINGQGGNALKNDGPFIRIKEQLIPGATMKVIVSAKGDDVSKISHDKCMTFLLIFFTLKGKTICDNSGKTSV